jgi:hypothetical protein
LIVIQLLCRNAAVTIIFAVDRASNFRKTLSGWHCFSTSEMLESMNGELECTAGTLDIIRFGRRVALSILCLGVRCGIIRRGMAQSQ